MQRVFENLCHDLINRAAHVDSELGVIQKISPFQKGFVNDRSLFYYSDQSFTCQPFLYQSKGSMIIWRICFTKNNCRKLALRELGCKAFRAGTQLMFRTVLETKKQP
ncbi:hypothetical protein CLOSTMETH_00095 [[Clostridium] methylpentosum DSM 5476]|uniref:Uncharacterized protein n=1 Tax=[Clostridium] methylpentosum DSM 5476 TaxID=537013 RepID=C0E8E9_9FIRM|nr:hypothetical protein CLOSTMETH_00095 [[Clostridium] methylpentosum DSM 5476]